jgi:hypothetical protein
MTKIYIAFYDDKDGGSRENWNTFYTPWVASSTRNGAIQRAKDAIRKKVKEDIAYEFEVDIDAIAYDDLDDEVRNELDYNLKCYQIEVQEGELQ